MKKLAAIMFCLLLAFSFVACSGAGGGNGGSGNGSNESANGGDNTRQSEYYPDAAIEGQNTFTLTKKSKDGNDAVLTLKIGGNDVKIAGFKIFVKFDKKNRSRQRRALFRFYVHDRKQSGRRFNAFVGGYGKHRVRNRHLRHFV